MNISTVKLVYFSPTGTTKKTLQSIAKGIQAESIVDANLTQPDTSVPVSSGDKNELVIFGVPVYGGRVPGIAAERLKEMSGEGMPAAVVVVYGNRAYDNALFELKHLAEDMGYMVVAGGAFIGEHSYSNNDFPIAAGRPDAADVEKAIAFGESIREKLASFQSLDDFDPVTVPGVMPAEGGRRPPSEEYAETIEDLCDACGICADVCPTGAITIAEQAVTDAKKCIRCCACVKECPTKARVMNSERIKGAAKRLSENFSRRAEPEIFI